METSIFEFEEDCPLEKDSCCKKEAKSCCSKDANQQEKPCSKKDATYLKLNSEFEKPNLADLSFTTDPLPQISSFPQLTSAKTLRTEVNLHNFGPTRLYLQYSVFRC